LSPLALAAAAAAAALGTGGALAWRAQGGGGEQQSQEERRRAVRSVATPATQRLVVRSLAGPLLYLAGRATAEQLLGGFPDGATGAGLDPQALLPWWVPAACSRGF
jgi:hypothetical protein